MLPTSCSCQLTHFWLNAGEKLGSINRQSQNNVKIEVDKQRAFGGWRSCFVHCNIIWTWLVLLPPVGLASFCWHFAVICTLQSGPFSPHQKCFYARVSGCLWCLPSAPVREREQGLCSGAEGGRLLCALSVFTEGENWLKGCQGTWKHTSIHTHTCTHAHRRAVFSLSAARPKRTECLKWTQIHKARLHTSTHTMLITQVSCLCLSFSKAIETWGWWTQPWSKTVVLGLKTWQRKTTHSVKRCVCSESSITNDTAVRYEATITERCSHVFPCRAANPTDGNRNLLLRKVF